MDIKDIKAVICDQDETLLQRERHYELFFDMMARRFGKQFDPNSDLRRRSLAVPWKAQVVPDMIETLDLPITVDEYDLWAKAFLNAVAPMSRPMPGVEPLLHFLCDIGVKLAIATSCEEGRLAPSWSSCPHLFEMFDVVVAGDDSEVKRGKPAPDILLVAAKRLGVAPERCLYVGDNIADMQAADAANMRFVAVPNYLLNRSDFLGSFMIFSSLKEFPVEEMV